MTSRAMWRSSGPPALTTSSSSPCRTRSTVVSDQPPAQVGLDHRTRQPGEHQLALLLGQPRVKCLAHPVDPSNLTPVKDPIRPARRRGDRAPPLGARPWPATASSPTCWRSSGAEHESAALLEDPLSRIATVFGLSELDTDLLFVAASVDLDIRFTTVFSRLTGTPHAQRPTVALASSCPASAPSRSRPGTGSARNGPLRRHRLLTVEGLETFLWRAVSVPERIVGQLLGDESPAVEVAAMLTHDALGRVTPEAEHLGRSLVAGAMVGHVKARPGTSGLAVARGAFESIGIDSIVVDLSRRRPSDDPVFLTALAAREAGLLAGGLILLGADDVTAAERAMLATVETSPVPVVVVDNLDWKGDWMTTPAITIEARELDREARTELWGAIVDEAARTAEPDAWRDLIGLRLTTDEIAAAARAAVVVAAAEASDVTVAILRDCARRQGSTSLSGSALRVKPRVQPRRRRAHRPHPRVDRGPPRLGPQPRDAARHRAPWPARAPRGAA